MSIPRRNRLDLNTAAELAIYNAIQEVENTGADKKLTKAIIFLCKARNLVADYIDRNDKSIIMAKQVKKYKYRSAVTGKLVTKAYAQQNPDTTVKELIKSKKV